jgi:hypothetical protein
MEKKIIKKIENDDSIAEINRRNWGHSEILGGRRDERSGMSFWDYIITFEDDTVYKMTRTRPIESESNGFNVGDTVTFIIKEDRIQKVKPVTNK